MSQTILVVDDNEMNRDMLSRRLRRQKYEVDIAVDGESALKMVQQKHYALILLDIMMPGMSGYEVLDTLKNNTHTRHIPVIMISAVDDLDSVVRCIEMGAEDYLFKPFNPVLLKARVSSSLARAIATHHQPTSQLQQLVARMDDAMQPLRDDGFLDDTHPLAAIFNELKAIAQSYAFNNVANQGTHGEQVND